MSQAILDLSTSTNPQPWPVPPLTGEDWQRLPDSAALKAAAANHYGNQNILAVAGIQGAIRMLPYLFPPAVVAAIGPLESCHTEAWQRAGHRLRTLHGATMGRAIAAATPLVLFANPNPVTGGEQSRNVAVDAAKQLKKRGGWLIVDESLADPLPELSVASLAGSDEAPNLIVIRALDAFFGLCGAPCGFVLAAPDHLTRLADLLAPWPLSGPLAAAASRALEDTDWQTTARQQLGKAGQRLGALLAAHGEVIATPLYATLSSPQVAALHAHLVRFNILTRRCDQPELLRFGLPGSAAGWQRLATALDEWKSR
jgi:cobalamin biosynthesis protein CobC